MTISKHEAETALKEILDDLSEELEIETSGFDRDTSLVDLGLESISLVYLVSEMQQHFGLGDQLFRQLRDADQLLKEMSLGDVVDAVVAADSQKETQHG
ncbi:acyl carrier protein [Sulfitobacter sp. JB4-11]|uniref:acyl carrier protein n=1 Tax=Sulfitobacter rhodophyticola TaxID=3238304 RepID=UPI00351848E2